MIAAVQGHAGVPVELKGHAYDFGRRIVAIQFSLDEGRTWTTYETPGTNDYQNLSWTFRYTPERPGRYRLRVRSVNDRGEASPEHALVRMEVA